MPIHLILAPAEFKKLVKSIISGSHAKLCKTVLPFAKTAANIAFSVKDYSTINLKSIFTKDTPFCIEAKQKKQEFGGASANVAKIECQSKLIKDENASIKFTSNEL